MNTYDDEGDRVHDDCARCGRGSCPGSGWLGEDFCDDDLRPARSTWNDAMSDSPAPSGLPASGDLEARD